MNPVNLSVSRVPVVPSAPIEPLLGRALAPASAGGSLCLRRVCWLCGASSNESGTAVAQAYIPLGSTLHDIDSHPAANTTNSLLLNTLLYTHDNNHQPSQCVFSPDARLERFCRLHGTSPSHPSTTCTTEATRPSLSPLSSQPRSWTRMS